MQIIQERYCISMRACTDNRQPTTDVGLGPVMLRDNSNDLYYLKEGQARRLRVIIFIIPAANSTPLPLHS